MRKICLGDCLMVGVVTLIGLAEAVHLAALFSGWTISRYAIIWGGISGLAVLGGVLFVIISRKKWGLTLNFKRENPGRTVKILYGIFIMLLISQLIFIWLGDNSYRQGDMTLEVVQSFLASDGIYQVNPMTGTPYTAGMPIRLKILCLPTLYAGICKITGLNAEFTVRTLIPTITLINCYVAFGVLAVSLFPAGEDKAYRKRACLLTAAALLLWVGTYRYGMDGFDLLYCGWQGGAIRNCVLIPWLISLCIRRKWLSALLCVLAEVCIVWTLYGCGWCLFLAAGMAVAIQVQRRLKD